MNKQSLVSRVAKRTDLPKAAVADVVDAVIETVTETVSRGQRVTLAGFGTFERRRRAARLGRNPHTGDAVKIPPTTIPMFRPGMAFKEAVLPKKRPRKRSATHTTSRRR